MKTSSVVASTGFLLATLAAGNASAVNAEFILANNTQFSVYYVYYWPVNSQGPGPDRLGNETIPSGSRVTFTPSHGECNYHIRVRLENRKYQEWNNVNLCGLSSVTLHYDNLSDIIWASSSVSRYPDTFRSEDRLVSRR